MRIGLYERATGLKFFGTTTFAFYAAHAKELPLSIRGYGGELQLASSRSVPPRWREELSQAMHQQAIGQGLGTPLPIHLVESNGIRLHPVGTIDYWRLFKTARIGNLFPKEFVGGMHSLKRFGYYLELLATKRLQRCGLQTVRSKTNSPMRIGQLARVGLKGKRPIGEWLKGLGRGLRRTKPAQKKE